MNEQLINPFDDPKINTNTEFFQLGPLQEMLEERLADVQQPLGGSALRALKMTEE